MNSAKSRRFYTFGPFRLDAAEKILLRDGQPVTLTVKDFETLLALVENGGRLLEKDEFLRRVWPNTFVEENNLAKHISTLRQALGKDKSGRKYIETVPRRGYRFVCPVSEVEAEQTLEMEKAIPSPGPRAEETSDTTGGQNLIAKVKRRKQRALLMLTIISLAVVASFGSAYKYLRARGTEKFSQMRIMRLPNTGNSILATISPDGKFIAHVIGDSEQQGLWLRQIKAGTDAQIVPAVKRARYLGITFSPDGEHLYYVVADWESLLYSLYRIPALGGTPTKVIEDVDSPVTFSPDGKRLAFRRGYRAQSETGLIVANSDGSGEYVLAKRKNPNDFAFGFPAWSPDGKVIACPASSDERQNAPNQLVEVWVEEKVERPLASGRWDLITSVAWLADGSGLIMTAREEASSPLQVWRLSYPDGKAGKVTNDLNNYNVLSLSADLDRLAVMRSESHSNVWVAADGNATRAYQITSGTGNHEGIDGISWTPDGRTVFTSYASGDSDLWVMNADGTGRKQLTAGAGKNRAPQVSPDGRYIVFESSRAGNRHIWRIDIDGGNPKQLTNGDGEARPRFSPDGRHVYFSQDKTLKPIVGRIPVDGGAIEWLRHIFSETPAVSPEGDVLAYPYETKEQSDKWMAAYFSPVDKRPVKIFDFKLPVFLPAGIHWSKDGKALMYVGNRGGVANIWSQSPESGRPEQLTDFKSDQIWNFAWSRDGKRLAIARGPVIRDLVLISDFK